MDFNDEKDYIMRMIKQLAVFFMAMLLGKENLTAKVTLLENETISGKTLEDYYGMIDDGNVNEAENILLDGIDYSCKEDVGMAILFYQYLGEKEKDFLQENNYSQQEALDGLKQLVTKSGFENVFNILEQ